MRWGHATKSNARAMMVLSEVIGEFPNVSIAGDRSRRAAYLKRDDPCVGTSRKVFRWCKRLPL